MTRTPRRAGPKAAGDDEQDPAPGRAGRAPPMTPSRTPAHARWPPCAVDDDEQDPDATVHWSVAAAATRSGIPTPRPSGPARTTRTRTPPPRTPWRASTPPRRPRARRIPETTAAWPADADDDEPAPGEPPAGDDAGPQTVELEALPGGNTDDQTAEPERKRD